MTTEQLDHQQHILVIEDNPTTSKMLALFLKDAGYQVTCVDDGQRGMDGFRNGHFDLILLDLMLPDVDGMTVCSEIRAQSEVPIVMLTAKSTEDDIVEGLEAGADDYVCKPFGSRELLARIRCCLRDFPESLAKRKRGDDEGVFCVGGIVVDTMRRVVRMDGLPIKLTKSEFKLLATMVQSPGRVFTRNQLVDRIFGPNYDGYERSIDTHVWNLRKKLGEPKGNPKYIVSEPGVGYRLNDQHAI